MFELKSFGIQTWDLTISDILYFKPITNIFTGFPNPYVRFRRVFKVYFQIGDCEIFLPAAANEK